MYTFQISADSPQALYEKQLEFVRTFGAQTRLTNNSELSEYADEAADDQPVAGPVLASTTPQQSPPVDIDVNRMIRTDEPKQALELDSNGMSWDARIHSANKSKNKDGSWRYIRGIDKGSIKVIEAELRRSLPTQSMVGAQVVAKSASTDSWRNGYEQQEKVPQSPFGAPPVIGSGVAQEVYVPPSPAPTVQVEAPYQAAPQVAQQQSAPLNMLGPAPAQEYQAIPIPGGARMAHTFETFQNNIATIFANLINEKKFDQPYVEQLKKFFKVQEIWQITASQKNTRMLYEEFANMGFITKMD